MDKDGTGEIGGCASRNPVDPSFHFTSSPLLSTLTVPSEWGGGGVVLKLKADSICFSRSVLL